MPVPLSAAISTGPVSSPRASAASAAATPGGALQEETLATLLLRLDRRMQALLDRVAPHKMYRWLTLAALLCIFMLRMVMLEGFYIVTYVLFIFILNQFILFLQPKDRASLLAKAAAAGSATDDDANNASAAAPPLPTMDDDEFRPFVRRLPEFKFWYSTTYATVLAFCATFFRAFDVPVFWPVLLFYFVLLFATTMRRQWMDMKKLKYVPWDIGAKKVYKSDPKRVSVTRPAARTDVVASSSRAPPSTPVPTVNVVTKKPTAASGAPQSPAAVPTKPAQT